MAKITDNYTTGGQYSAANATAVKNSVNTLYDEITLYYLATNPAGYTTNVGTVTAVTGGTGLSSTGGAAPALSLDDTPVTAGAYTNSNITVDAQGRITSAANGTAGAGDMLAATYDPNTVNGDAFDMDNMVEGTAKILTTAERTILGDTSGINTGDQDLTNYGDYVAVTYGSGTDQAATIQAAHDAASDGDTLKFTAGVVKVETQINITKKISIICDDNTVFQTISNIHIFDASVAGAEGFSFINGRFLGTAGGQGTGAGIESQFGIYCSGVGKKYLLNLHGNNLGGALVYADQAGGAAYDGGTIKNCRAISCYTGIWIDQGGEYITVDNCFGLAGQYGIKLRGGNHNVIGGNYSSNIYGIHLLNGGNSGHGTITGVIANHCITYNVWADVLTAIRGEAIVGCCFWAGNIYIRLSDGVTFNGCSIQLSSSFEVDGCTIVMSGNYMSNSTGITLSNGGQVKKNGNYFYNGANDLILWDNTTAPDSFGEAITKADSVALGSTIDWNAGSFQPVTGSGAEAITSITNPTLGVCYITITGGTSCSVVVTGLTFLKSNVFNGGSGTNVLKITCIDAVTPLYHAEWVNDL